MSKLFIIIALVGGLAPAAGPGRIISTTPSITEILFALGVGERVVGVTTYCHYPAAALKIAKIGTYMQPNLEAIVGMRPDLVVVEKNPLGITDGLRRVGLRVAEVEAQSARGLPGAIRGVAKAVGISGEGLVQRIERELGAVRGSVAGKRVRVMFVVGRNPGALDGLVAAGKGSYLEELLAVAGGVNIFSDSVSSYPRVSLEEVIARKPEVIIDMGDMADTVGVTAEQKAEVRGLWSKYKDLPAVRNGKVFAVASDIYVVPGPRIGEAAREFARMLH